MKVASTHHFGEEIFDCFLMNACTKHPLMKTGFVSKDGKSYAYIEFENAEEIDKFFDEVEEKATARKLSYETRPPK